MEMGPRKWGIHVREWQSCGTSKHMQLADCRVHRKAVGWGGDHAGLSVGAVGSMAPLHEWKVEDGRGVIGWLGVGWALVN